MSDVKDESTDAPTGDDEERSIIDKAKEAAPDIDFQDLKDKAKDAASDIDFQDLKDKAKDAAVVVKDRSVDAAAVVKEKVSGFVGDNEGKIDSAIEKTGHFVDEKLTRNKFSDKIDKAQDLAKGAVSKVGSASDNEGEDEDAPGEAAAPTTSAAGDTGDLSGEAFEMPPAADDPDSDK